MSSKSPRVTCQILYVWLVLTVLVLCPKVACAASKTGGTITFSEMKVEASGKDRLILGRSVSVVIEGKVTNGTGGTITSDDLPHLAYGDDAIELSLDEKGLPSGKSCKVSGKGSIPVDGHDVPDASFSGSTKYAGLDGAEKDLASQLSEIEKDFAAKDKKKADDKRKREEKKAHEEEAVEAFKSCVGKPASEAMELAAAAGYEPTYYDSFGVDVTEILTNAEGDTKILSAPVSAVDINKKWLFLGSSAKVTLDYTEPKAAKERAKEEARETILHCVGKSAGKTQILVDNNDFDLVMLDKHGADITKGVRKARKGSPVRKAKVSSVEIDKTKDSKREVVTVMVNYTSNSSRKRINKEHGYPSSVTFSGGTIRVVDEHPAVEGSTLVILINGTLTNNDSWTVNTEYLPHFVTQEDDDPAKEYALRLDGSIDELGAGKSVGYEVAVRVYSRNLSVSFRGPYGKPRLNGADAFATEILAKHQQQLEVHDANIGYYQAEQQRAWEESRRAVACYVTQTGDCYHSRTGCPALSRSKNLYETTVGWAQDNGLTACERCH